MKNLKGSSTSDLSNTIKLPDVTDIEGDDFVYIHFFLLINGGQTYINKGSFHYVVV
ncbi:hypothetical protein [Haemophilus influenzae]|uniref:hypothetical protein n=1 Tax=Haemophilus influenzae TaxID=727 RepID=UPI0015E5DC02|nr:hypothetical protein [Haemophilus influenzae]